MLHARVTPGEIVHFIPQGGVAQSSVPEYSMILATIASAIADVVSTVVPATSSSGTKTTQRDAVTVNNIMDPNQIIPVLGTKQGQKALLNFIKSNSSAIKMLIQS
jgi:hypothetical protein